MAIALSFQHRFKVYWGPGYLSQNLNEIPEGDQSGYGSSFIWHPEDTVLKQTQIRAINGDKDIVIECICPWRNVEDFMLDISKPSTNYLNAPLKYLDGLCLQHLKWYQNSQFMPMNIPSPVILDPPFPRQNASPPGKTLHLRKWSRTETTHYVFAFLTWVGRLSNYSKSFKNIST